MTNVSSNERVSWDTKSQLDLHVQLWNLSVKEANNLIQEASTPMERFTSSSLNAMPNTNFNHMSSGFVEKANILLSSIPKEKIELLAVIVKLSPQYPGIYEKMQTLLTDQSRGILDSLRSKVKILQNAKTRRNSKKAQAAANSLKARLNSIRGTSGNSRNPKNIANSLKARLNAIRRQGGRRKTLRRRNP